jgi:hypothetical protein
VAFGWTLALALGKLGGVARDAHMKEAAATGAYAPLLELLAAPFRVAVISQFP